MDLKREFSWSYSRYALFEYCHRAYYYYYYGSWNGWKACGDEVSQKLYRLKKMTSIHSWVEAIFRKELYSSFCRSDLNCDRIFRVCKSKIYRSIVDIRNNNISHDCRVEFLSEWYFDKISLDELKFEADSHLSNIVAKFAKSKALSRLLTVQMLSIKQLKQPSSFYHNGIKIWTTPNFIWSEVGCIKVLNLYFNDPLKLDKWPFKGTLDLMSARDIFVGYDDIEVLSYFITDDIYPQLTILRNSQEVKNIIDKSSHKMLELTSLDTDIREELFPKSCDDHCGSCNFREFCDLRK